MGKAEISWKSKDEEGVKREVYVRCIGADWFRVITFDRGPRPERASFALLTQAVVSEKSVGGVAFAFTGFDPRQILGAGN